MSSRNYYKITTDTKKKDEFTIRYFCKIKFLQVKFFEERERKSL